MELLILVLIIAAAVIAEQSLYARLGAKKVRYRCGFSAETLTEGEETELVEIVENRKLLPIPWLKAELTIPKFIRPTGGESVVTGKDRFVTGFFMVKSYSGIRRVRRVKTLRRGVYSIIAARVQTSDILGGVRISLSASDTGKTLTVLPRSAQTQSVLPERLRRRTGEQLVRSSLVTDLFFTAGVRTYEPGDPMGRIHWKATAHMQELMVRQEEKTARRCLLVLLNVQTASEHQGVRTIDEALAEHTIRLCVQLLEEACREEYTVVLCSNGLAPDGEMLYMEEMGGGSALERQLYALAELSVPEQKPFRTLLRQYHIVSPDMSAVLLTPYTDDAAAEWKAQNPEAAVIVSAYGTDEMGLADAVIPEPERGREICE